MKNNLIKPPISHDRLATPEEVLAAVMPFSDPIEECNSDILREIARDIGGFTRIPARDFEVSMMVQELMQQEDKDVN